MAKEVSTTAAASADAATSQSSKFKTRAKRVGPAKTIKKSDTVPNRPRTSEMVTEAIAKLGERGGSSLQAIKKYIVSTYKLDGNKKAYFIKKYLRAAVSEGILAQTKGTGVSGSFKIAVPKTETVKPKKRVVTKKTTPKKSPVKKSTAPKDEPKKTTATPTKQKRKITRTPAAKPPKAKSPSKAKKITKAPSVKPKSPRPKKVAPKSPKATTKRTAAAKK